eukprot:COSAG06_NODE_16357_length_1005_cov_8.816777_2_plen_140_part_00
MKAVPDASSSRCGSSQEEDTTPPLVASTGCDVTVPIALRSVFQFTLVNNSLAMYPYVIATTSTCEAEANPKCGVHGGGHLAFLEFTDDSILIKPMTLMGSGDAGADYDEDWATAELNDMQNGRTGARITPFMVFHIASR